jgi:ferredoxin
MGRLASEERTMGGSAPRATARRPPREPDRAPASRAAGLAAWLRGTVGRKGLRTYRVRLLVQGGFALASLLLGVQFARFLAAIEAGRATGPGRPPGVEAYLPISGLMGLVDWVNQGRLNDIHPAATVLFLIFVGIALVFRKAFCSWICPVGFLSEALARLGRRLLGRNLRPWRVVDVPLRGLRYLLLGFFLWAIFLSLDAAGLRDFIESPYNRVSDIKMWRFFAHLSLAGGAVLGVLALGSVLVHGFWCRYLCPYGALLGLVSFFSPSNVRRDPAACTDCGRCDEVCMARLPVSRSERVTSPECTGCLDCLASCPHRQVLTVGTRRRRAGVLAFAAGILLLFAAGYVAARAAGAWQNGIGHEEYVRRVVEIDEPVYSHPGR